MKRFVMITTTILVWGIPLICFFGVANGEIQNDPYKNDSLYNRYSDYGKKWMYFPDGDGKPTIVLLEMTENMVLAPGDNLKAVNDDLLYVQFMLYTRKNRNEAYILNYDDKENLEKSAYDPSKHTKFVTHGWRSSGSSNTCQTIKNGFLEAEDVNVVVVDWGKLASDLLYPVPVQRTKTVGAYLGDMIDYLADQGTKTKNVHLVGHSLGAHISGIAANHTTKGRIGRITGLDPAKPMFEGNTNYEDQLDKGDAHFVDIIHTCGGVLGFSNNLGHVDIYPNGGTPSQPGCCCLPEIIEACSHGRSWQYFAESITSKGGFKAIKCSNWDQFKKANCTHAKVETVGYPIKQHLRGSFYTVTNDASPYAEDAFLAKFNLK